MSMAEVSIEIEGISGETHLHYILQDTNNKEEICLSWLYKLLFCWRNRGPADGTTTARIPFLYLVVYILHILCTYTYGENLISESCSIKTNLRTCCSSDSLMAESSNACCSSAISYPCHQSTKSVSVFWHLPLLLWCAWSSTNKHEDQTIDLTIYLYLISEWPS
jgi:hypothetical protein